MSEDQQSQAISDLMKSSTAFFRALEALRSRNAAAEGISATEFRALLRVVDLGAQTPKRLAASMFMSTGTITAVTDRLVAKGLLERVANEADRRSVLLTPTSEGVEMLARLYASYRQVFVDGVGLMPYSKVNELRAMLDVVTSLFEAAALAPDEAFAGKSAGLPVLGGPSE